MKKHIVSILILVSIISCSSQNVGETIIVKTKNPNTPYIYKNGFKDYTITPVLSIEEKESVYISELRFNAVYSAMYIQKLMYDRFGKWNKVIRPSNKKVPVLVWENVKLFENNSQLYNVSASGVESWNEMYASAIISNSSKEDCLSEKALEKDSLIKYFSEGIKNLKKNERFYNAYWKMENSK